MSYGQYAAFAIIALISAVSGQATAEILEVGNGHFATIKAAIDTARDGDTVVIQPGRYTGEGNCDLDFNGKAITVRSVDPGDESIVAATIIDCNGTRDTPRRGFHFHSGEGPDSKLEGLTISNGHAQEYGGAIFCEGASSPTISRCTLVHNASGNGRPISTGHGGAIACVEGSDSTISQCTIRGNETISGGSTAGGGVYAEDSSLVVVDCYFAQNVSWKGGGLCCDEGSSCIVRCVIEGNTARSGGGIYCDGGNPYIWGCVVEGNQADYGGGVYCSCLDGQANVLNCVVRDNVAELLGGGLSCGSNVIVAGCLVVFNATVINGYYYDPSEPVGGGGIAIGDTGCIISNCTISRNMARFGSAIRAGCPNASPRAAEIYDSIIWGNLGHIGSEIAVGICCGGCVNPSQPVHVRVHGSCVAESTGMRTPERELFLPFTEDANCIHANPRFVDAAKGDFRLADDSPCIDVCGDGSHVDTNGSDLAGDARIVDGDADGTAQLDMGAYESTPAAIPVVVPTPQNLVFRAYESDPAIASQRLVMASRGPTESESWKIDCNCSWLDVCPASDAGTGEAIIMVDATGLAPGVYHSELWIEAAWAANSPFRVPVELRIGHTLRVPDAYGTLQEAMDVAEFGDLVLLADGVYTGPGNDDLTCQANGVTIRSEHGPGHCILDCNGDTSYGTGVNISAGGARLFVEGLTLTGGEYGFLAYDTAVSLHDCWLTNFDLNLGGVLHLDECLLDRVVLNIGSSDVRISGCEIKRSATGLSCWYSSLLIEDTVIAQNSSSVLNLSYCPEAILNRCVISGNGHPTNDWSMPFGLSGTTLDLRSCTVVGNVFPDDPYWDRYYDASGTVRARNSIFWGNPRFDERAQSLFSFEHCDVQDTPASEGVISADPLFAVNGYWDPNGTPDDIADDFWVDGDYHLRSQVGRWDPTCGDWVADEATSPCIDAGDPGSDPGNELQPNGGRINMGAYGGTTEASKSVSSKVQR